MRNNYIIALIAGLLPSLQGCVEPREASIENFDVQRARREVRSENSGLYLERNGEGMSKHVMEKHPDVAADMEKMHREDPEK